MEYDLYKLSLGAALAAAIQQRTGLTHNQCTSIEQSGSCIFVEQDNGATLMVVVSQVPQHQDNSTNQEQDECKRAIDQDQSHHYQLAFYASLSPTEDETGFIRNPEHLSGGNNHEPY